MQLLFFAVPVLPWMSPVLTEAEHCKKRLVGEDLKNWWGGPIPLGGGAHNWGATWQSSPGMEGDARKAAGSAVHPASKDTENKTVNM